MPTQLRALLLLAISNCAALAQNQINGPDLHFWFDTSAGGIRRILGVPGAAYLSRAERPDFPVASVVFSATGEYGLAVRESDGQLFLVSFATGQPVYSAIDGLASPSGRAFISAAGRAAAVCGQDCKTITRLAGLPQSASVAGTVTLDNADAVAIADNGAILAAATDESGASLLYAGPGSAPRVIGRAGRAAGIAIFPDGSAGVFVDSAANTLVRIDDLAGSATFSLLAGPDQGVASPLGVAIARSGRLALVAMPGSVLAVDLAGSTGGGRFDCACALTRIENLSGDAVLRVTDGINGPLWLFDAEAAQPRFVFVPPPAQPRRRPEVIR